MSLRKVLLAAGMIFSVLGASAAENTPVPIPEPDAEVKERIETALIESPRFEVDDVVIVDLRGKEATLTGTVTTWDEHRHASRIALEAGASEVFSRIKVRTDPFASDQIFHYKDVSDIGRKESGSLS